MKQGQILSIKYSATCYFSLFIETITILIGSMTIFFCTHIIRSTIWLFCYAHNEFGQQGKKKNQICLDRKQDPKQDWSLYKYKKDIFFLLISINKNCPFRTRPFHDTIIKRQLYKLRHRGSGFEKWDPLLPILKFN